jgi:hypothetical protein
MSNNEQLIAAAQQALEVLLDLSAMDTYQNEDDEVGRKVCCGEVSYRPHSPDCKTMGAITSLRTAIHEWEAAEKHEPVAWGVDWGKAGDIPCVSIIKRLPDGRIQVLAVEYAPYSYTTPSAAPIVAPQLVQEKPNE